MHLVSMGRGVAVLPDSAIGQVPRALICVPVVDARPTVLVLAWLQESRYLPLATLVRVATRVAALRPPGRRDRSVTSRPGR